MQKARALLQQNLPAVSVGLSDVDIAAHMLLVFAFNVQLCNVLPYLDEQRASEPGHLAHLAVNNRLLVLPQVKKRMLKWCLVQTRAKRNRKRRARVLIDRAAAKRADRSSDIGRSQCTFVQLFTALHSLDPETMRRRDHVFKVSLRNEAGIDAGGPYREVLDEALRDLFSGRLPLFVESRNTRNGDSDRFVPNPDCISPLHIRMFEFVGKLMGLSLRTSANLPFLLAQMCWKVLTCADLDMSDLADIDGSKAAALQDMIGFEPPAGGEPQAAYEAAFCEIFDESESSGLDIDRSYQLRAQDAQVLLRSTLASFDAQLRAMRRGFFTIVPPRGVSFFTAEELETLVAGSSIVDIGRLRQHTQLSGYRQTDPTIQSFWRVLESFSNAERCMFLKFAWGRSRLPTGNWARDDYMKIYRVAAPLGSLPVAHTCFFQLDLPPYGTDELLREKLLYAIHEGQGSMLLA